MASSHRDAGRCRPSSGGAWGAWVPASSPREEQDDDRTEDLQAPGSRAHGQDRRELHDRPPMLIAAGDRPEPVEVDWTPPVSDEALTNATGHDWRHWFGLMDDWGATAHTHTEMARWLVDEHGVPGWWSQSITVGYEQARGLRVPGQHADGFSVSASKTVGGSRGGAVRRIRRRCAPRTLASGRRPPPADGDEAEDRALRLGGRLDAGGGRIQPRERMTGARSPSNTPACPTPTRPTR